MTQTLLFDLDNTLLDNAIDSFLPVYINKLAAYLADIIPPDVLISALMSGTRRMVHNQNPDCTLEQVFDSFFFPALGVAKQDLSAKIARFYVEVFPTLQQLTRPRPEAIQVVNEALARGYTLCVATNPLFPREAISQRISWAGLDPHAFHLTTSFESFHFAKPHPAFYAEILSLLEWPESPIIMVGDNQINDIQGAREAGLSTFWITNQNQDLVTPVAGAGKLEELIPWIDRFAADRLPPDYHTPAACTATLLATPAVLDGVLERLPERSWTHKPDPNEWSLNEIIYHLRDVDQEVNLPRLETILSENNPFIAGADTDPWAQERNYFHQNGFVALHQFIETRTRLVERINGIHPDLWQRPARHSIFGPTDFLELVWLITRHDRLHVSQVLHTLKAIPAEYKS